MTARRAAEGDERSGARRRRALAAGAATVLVAVAAAALALIDPFASASPGGSRVAGRGHATGTFTVVRRDLTAQTEVTATLGYVGNYIVDAPSGAGPAAVAQAQQAVAEDQQALSADQQAAADAAGSGSQQVASAQAAAGTATATFDADQAAQARTCAAAGATSATCASVTEKVGADRSAVTQADQQLAAAQAGATGTRQQDQAKVAADQVKLQGDQAALAALEADAVNPGTTYTALPVVGAVITEDQAVYSVSGVPVPLLYGPVPVYRAFVAGMPPGDDVGELTADLIAQGFGAGLTQSDQYSAATEVAVEYWQRTLGLPVTGEILLGQAVFEPGPIEVTSVVPAVGQQLGAGGGGGSAGGGGGEILTATSTTHQVTIALDASQQSEVKPGDTVTITLPDGATTPGVVSSVGTVASVQPSSTPGTGGNGAPTVTVLVTPTRQTAGGHWDQAPVDVTITTGQVRHVLVVPVQALLARPGGGYAVQALGSGGASRLAAVTLGLFDDADGLVQVSGSGLRAGTRVVVPTL